MRLDEPLVERDPDLRRAMLDARLDEISTYPANWNGHGATVATPAAIQAGRDLLKLATALLGPLPGSIGADVEGGVALNWYGGELTPRGSRRRFASVSVDNDLDYVLITHDRLTKGIEAKDLSPEVESLASAIAEAMRFCNG